MPYPDLGVEMTGVELKNKTNNVDTITLDDETLALNDLAVHALENAGINPMDRFSVDATTPPSCADDRLVVPVNNLVIGDY